METWTIIAICAAVAVVVLLAVARLMSSRHGRSVKQTAGLREGFGPEYAKAVEDQGRSGAEHDLLERQKRADLFPVRALSAIESTSYAERWAVTQGQFVENPGAALTSAGRLITEVIAARGYPAASFEQGASALSVDHPRAVQEYRAANEVALRNQRNPLPTDDLRAAMVQYHTVFTELVESGASAAPVQAA